MSELDETKQAASPQVPVKRRSPLRWFARLVLALLLFLVTALGVVLTTLHSESGTRWLIVQAPKWLPFEFRIAEVDGSLTGPLKLRDIRMEIEGVALSLEDFRLNWNPMALIDRQLWIAELRLSGLDLRLPEGESTAPGEPFPGLVLPLAVRLDRLLLEDLSLHVPGSAEPVQVERIDLALHGSASQIRIEQLVVEALQGRVALSGQAGLEAGLPMDVRLDWRLPVPDGPQLQGGGTLQGSLAQLQVSQMLTAPVQAQVDAQLHDLETSPAWRGELVMEQANLAALAPEARGLLGARIQIQGDPATNQFSGRLDFDEPELGRASADFELGFDGERLLAKRVDLTLPHDNKIALNGEYRPDNELGRFQAELAWQALQWPLPDSGSIQAKAGQLSVKGKPDAYLYQLATEVRLPDLPRLSIKSSGRGDMQGMQIEEGLLALPKGRLNVTGQAGWQPSPSWDLSVTGRDLDPGQFQAEFPGQIELAAKTSGKLNGAALHASVSLDALQGKLRDYPLAARGRFELAGEQLAVHAFQLTSGESRVEVTGDLGESMDLTWSLISKDLASLLPDLAGTLEANGRLAGSVESPVLRTRFVGNGLKFEQTRLASLQGEVDVDLGAERILADLTANELQAGGNAWQTLTFKAAGTRAKHHLDLALQGQGVPELQLAIDAGLNTDDSWQGELRQADVRVPKAGDWQLRQPAAFLFGQTHQRLDQTCLKSVSGRLCAGFSADAQQGWRAEAEGFGLDLALLKPWLPNDITLTGHAKLEADLSADADGRMQGIARLELPEANLPVPLGDQVKLIVLSTTNLKAKLDDKGASADWRVPLGDLGQLRGEVNLPGLDLVELAPEQQSLQGKVEGKVDDLAFLSVLDPHLKNVRGRVDLDFDIGGKLATPQLKGQARLVEAAVDIPELGLEIRDVELLAHTPNLQQLSYTGRARSGEGRLKLSGETRLQPDQGFPTRIEVQGQDWVAVDIPEAEMQVSPRLVLEHSAKRSELDGEIHIPYARIRPREVPKGAISDSSDLVIVGAEQEQTPKTDPRFYSQLRILFGDRVSFDGFGLRTKLTGDLLVIDEPGRPVIGRGRVGVSGGTYRAYGQDLKIERGYALFADSPVDNPGLDVRAIREVDDVIAGLQVTGTLKKPNLSLFSTPSMPQRDLLSYLLLGRPPGEGAGGNVSLSSAIAATGAGEFTTEVGRQLGLDELRLDTAGSLAEASVVAGTYLSPRLYVQYVNQLASRETSLRFRYDLTDRVQVQTESGKTQAVDLFYTIER